MGPDTALQCLEDLQTKQPALATRLAEFADLYQRKLWHQLTLSIEESLTVPEFRHPDVLIPFYSDFINVFVHKLNPLRLAQIAVTVAEQHSNPQDAGVARISNLLLLWFSHVSHTIPSCL